MMEYVGYNKFLQIQQDRMINNPTYSEQKFENYLKYKKVSYKKQEIISITKTKKYIVDFLFFNKYIVEIDGGYHFTENQIKKDKIRDKELQGKGYKVFRLSNNEITPSNIQKIINRMTNIKPKKKNKNNNDSFFKVKSANDYF